MKVCFDYLKNKTVAVAVSGGADSMALIFYLLKHAKEYNMTVKAVNVEHGIRGQSSIDDSRFVKNWCEVSGVEFLGFSVDAPEFSKQNKIGLEEAARRLRYGCFEKVIADNAADTVATAHHKSDNAESVLFNILRGTGLKGLTGISPNSGYIVRPILQTTKAQIEAYVKRNNIPFVTDQTNYDSAYTRNYLRAEIIPKLKEVFPACEDALINLSDIAKSDDTYLQEQARCLVKESGGCVKVEFCEHKPLFLRAVIAALEILGAGRDYTSAGLMPVFYLQDAKNGSGVNLTGGVRAVKDYTAITLYKPFPAEFKARIFSQGCFEFCAGTVVIEPLEVVNMPPEFSNIERGAAKTRQRTLLIDRDKIPAGAVIRTRNDGDIFRPYGGGTKKLKKYLIDKKVPERERDKILLLAKGGEVLAVSGMEISDGVKVDESTKNVYKITVFNKK